MAIKIGMWVSIICALVGILTNNDIVVLVSLVFMISFQLDSIHLVIYNAINKSNKENK